MALSLPILLLLVVLILAAIIAPLTSRWRPHRDGCLALFTTILRWPQVWDLILWLLLLQVRVARHSANPTLSQSLAAHPCYACKPC